MKRIALAVGAALLAMNFASAQNGDDWVYGLPEAGIMPSYAHAAFLSTMRERHGGSSHLGMQRYALTLPLADPRRSGGRGWMFNAQLDARATLLDVRGSLDLKRDELYNLSIPLALIRPMGNGNRLTLAIAPDVSSDFAGTERFFDLEAFAECRVKASDSFAYGLGVGISPRFAQYGAVPFFSFEWKPTQEWEIRLKGYRLSALYGFSSRFAAGPFMEGIGGAWMVSTDRGDRIFRIRSFVAGVTGEYDFSQTGQRKRIITASIGAALSTVAQFCDRGGSKDAYETHHYRPGFYAALGVDFRF